MRIRNADGVLVAVPGKPSVMRHTTSASVEHQMTMNLVLARTLRADKIKRALAIIEEVYRGNPMTHDVWISFNQFSGGNINIRVVHCGKADQKIPRRHADELAVRTALTPRHLVRLKTSAFGLQVALNLPLMDWLTDLIWRRQVSRHPVGFWKIVG
jgi:hypothetical protein